jgi:hypothetical protein
LPQIEKLREAVWYPLPYLIYGGLAVASTIFFVFVIDETKNKEIPDSIEDF